MAEKIFNTRIQNKIDVKSNYVTKNPEIKKGELCFEDDGGIIKARVASTNANYNTLAYWPQATAVYFNGNPLADKITNHEERITALESSPPPSPIPSGYTQKTYTEKSSTNSYFELRYQEQGIAGQRNMTIEADIEYTNLVTNTYGCVCGSAVNVGGDAKQRCDFLYMDLASSPQQVGFGAGTSHKRDLSIIPSPTSRHNYRLVINDLGDFGEMFCDGINLDIPKNTGGSPVPIASGGNGVSMYFGRRHYGSEINLNGSLFKCYSFKIKVGGTTLVDLVPCQRDSDGIYGFWDTINQTFCCSANNTHFTGA